MVWGVPEVWRQCYSSSMNSGKIGADGWTDRGSIRGPRGPKKYSRILPYVRHSTNRSRKRDSSVHWKSGLGHPPEMLCWEHWCLQPPSAFILFLLSVSTERGRKYWRTLPYVRHSTNRGRNEDSVLWRSALGVPIWDILHHINNFFLQFCIW